MVLASNEKDKIASDQLKDVSQTWYTQWRYNRGLRAGPITLEVFRRAFLNHFFHREKREAKVEEFINLRQGGMSVQEYSFKFTKLSKDSPSLVCNPRDEMSRFVMEVSDDLVEECRS